MNQPIKERNYHLYPRALGTPCAYPLGLAPARERYRPVADWIGRLILPELLGTIRKAGFCSKFIRCPSSSLVAKKVRLRFNAEREVQARALAVTRNVIFNESAQKIVVDGMILAERVNRWRRVTPLESLAGSRPKDDLTVRLAGPVTLHEPPGEPPILIIDQEPVQITGLFVGLVTFVEAASPAGDRWRVRHYDWRHLHRASR